MRKFINSLFETFFEFIFAVGAAEILLLDSVWNNLPESFTREGAINIIFTITCIMIGVYTGQAVYRLAKGVAERIKYRKRYITLMK